MCVCCAYVFMFIRVVHVYAKVSHLSAAPSQDASSFSWHVYITCVGCFVKVSHVPVHIFLLCRVCMYMCMPRCHTFQQLPVRCLIFWLACVYTCVCCCGVAYSSPCSSALSHFSAGMCNVSICVCLCYARSPSVLMCKCAFLCVIAIV